MFESLGRLAAFTVWAFRTADKVRANLVKHEQLLIAIQMVIFGVSQNVCAAFSWHLAAGWDCFILSGVSGDPFSHIDTVIETGIEEYPFIF